MQRLRGSVCDYGWRMLTEWKKEIVKGARIILAQDDVIEVYIIKSTINFTLSDNGKPYSFDQKSNII